MHDELLRTTKASCGTISLYDQAEDSLGERRAFIRVGDDADGILSALETKVMAFEEPIVVSDYELPVPSIGNVRLEPPHSGVVSSLIVPIAYQEGIAGLIHLHASVADHFDTNRDRNHAISGYTGGNRPGERKPVRGTASTYRTT